ncbi:bifunctional methylenetetrahydrofolate dehydrogenase/methenyltetrahydrofolate cyclohydrolase FolD [Sphingosinicella soli]|uniref:Bifunctional protein FolD n=1 Tax=Sphingosinicella soli TaxID=333708 RepID=A0A7W7B487_9SPHN|nr:bifunctional methylenetetrahydrofolate dehydrogenase/methenyltetrahydrofolate cyclohydrolase FolD [Sphingosinicella soli]MBB4633702.1 methylenetetrahydrofolate dehydrogenase (NADP+)/methenyltetrahydrofolate cyclohydrolase [Sphingosinicella soli]
MKSAVALNTENEARIIDGRSAAAALCEDLKPRVAGFRARHGHAPGLAVILVGSDPASAIYVRRKGEQCRAIGIASTQHTLPAETSEQDVLDLVARLNDSAEVHGILVQLPLPPHIDTRRVLAAVSPAKDVDGFHVTNAGWLAIGKPTLAPCTPWGCIRLLRALGVPLRGKRALVVGRSVIVGRPMAQLLLIEDCTVTIAHRHSENLADLCREADILVVAVGIPGLIRGDWIKPGAVVIDVGINRLPPDDATPKGRIVGDVVFDEASAVARAITPVPGGVGPMTIACLLENTLRAAEMIAGD